MNSYLQSAEEAAWHMFIVITIYAYIGMSYLIKNLISAP